MSSDSSLAVAERPAVPPTACFAVQAAADPGLMPRILELFAKRGLVPTRLHGGLNDARDELTIDVELAGLQSELAIRLAAEMRAVWGVSLVLTTEKYAV